MEKMDFWASFLIPLIYVVLFMAAFVGLAVWESRKRRTRKPFGEDVRLTRMPGEYLWRKVIESDATELQWAFGLMIVPVLVGGVVLQVVSRFFNKSLIGLALAAVVFVFLLVFCLRCLLKRWKQRQKYYLAFFGERFVADCLEPLKEKGWFFFHDIQCQGATAKFNLDHVAVGPGGLWLVETKTWRKGRARRGMKEYKIEFDGAKVVWPWGEETESIEEAVENANWLQTFLQNRLGKRFDVFAVLAFPGYYVTERKLGAVRLSNPKNLPLVLTGRGNSVLKAEEIDLIRRQLAALCRDVEF